MAIHSLNILKEKEAVVSQDCLHAEGTWYLEKNLSNLFSLEI